MNTNEEHNAYSITINDMNIKLSFVSKNNTNVLEMVKQMLLANCMQERIST